MNMTVLMHSNYMYFLWYGISMGKIATYKFLRFPNLVKSCFGDDRKLILLKMPNQLNIIIVIIILNRFL